MFCGIQAEGGECPTSPQGCTREPPTLSTENSSEALYLEYHVGLKERWAPLQGAAFGVHRALGPERRVHGNQGTANYMRIVFKTSPSSRCFCDLTGREGGRASCNCFLSIRDGVSETGSDLGLFPQSPVSRTESSGGEPGVHPTAVSPNLPLPPRWPSGPRARPSRCCRPPAGSLRSSLNSHASLERENPVLPSSAPEAAAVLT